MKKNLVSIMRVLKIPIRQIPIGNHHRKKARFQPIPPKKLLLMRVKNLCKCITY